MELLTSLRNVGARLRAERFPDFKESKVFEVGLTRTGTTSLTRALQILGYQAAHYVNDLTGELCRFLGGPVPEDEFPWENRAPPPLHAG